MNRFLLAILALLMVTSMAFRVKFHQPPTEDGADDEASAPEGPEEGSDEAGDDSDRPERPELSEEVVECLCGVWADVEEAESEEEVGDAIHECLPAPPAQGEVSFLQFTRRPRGGDSEDEEGDHEEGDHEEGDHEEGDHEEGDHEEGDHEEGDHEEGDHEEDDHPIFELAHFAEEHCTE